ncbi:hypothetical protein [Naasia sp. SYSU D00057]|uniref:hypothetical protein n=1 Tax=Naasia sp. SYSU D00057 TaxID=2817380 RepID=UPI001B30492B|nr:hypothetical protein [Naasia sp. SYSU D00057]
MNLLISQTSTPRRVSASHGTANYPHPTDAPPEWLWRGIARAPEARDAWLEANALGEQLRRDWRRAGSKLADLRDSNPLAAVLEQAQREFDALEHQLADQTRRSKEALQAFDRIVSSGTVGVEERKQLAARYALDQQHRAEQALAELTEALDSRDQAYRIAGTPGVDWRLRPGCDYGKQRFALETVGKRVSYFDSRTVLAAAEGEVSA